MSGFAQLIILATAVLSAVNGRSIGETSGVNLPNQANYQEYVEQQEYSEQRAEVERPVRDVRRVENEQGGEYSREDSNSAVEEPNADSASFEDQSKMNGDEFQPASNYEVNVNRGSANEQEIKKDADIVDSNIADQRDEEGFRQSGTVDSAEQVSANFRRPRGDNISPKRQQAPNSDADTDAGRAVSGDVGDESYNEQIDGRPAKRAANTDGRYNSDNYQQEQDNEGKMNSCESENGENVRPAQYEQSVN